MEEKTMLRWLATGVALMFGAQVFGAQAGAADLKPEYRLSTVLGGAFPWGKAGERWAELVREGTQDRIVIKMYPGMSLVGGDQSREFSAIRQGVIDLAIGSTINWSPQVKELTLFSLPFLMPDHKAIDALTGGEVGKTLFAAIESKGVVPLAWGENGFREISNSKRPLRLPEHFRGLKIRFAVSPIFAETLTALGANPTQMSWADAQPALATGAIDGQENPLIIFTGANLAKLGQKHLTLWGYVADPIVFAVNREVWASWSAADQKVVREAALIAGRENIIQVRKGITGDDDEIIRMIESGGVTVTRLSASERDALRRVTRPVFDKWAKTIGEDLVKKAEAAIAAR
ncbi:TRAP-type transport system periplasmic protein [uncultured Gammaproteobacteria bacterium]